MAAMDCPAGVAVREWLPEVPVEALTENGSFVELPFAGFSNVKLVEACEGHYVEILADRVTDGSGDSHCEWTEVPLDKYVLGLAIQDRRARSARKVILGLIDNDGKPILTPKS